MSKELTWRNTELPRKMDNINNYPSKDPREIQKEVTNLQILVLKIPKKTWIFISIPQSNAQVL